MLSPEELLEIELLKPTPDQEIIEMLLELIYPPGDTPAQDMITEALECGGLEVSLPSD